MDRSASAEFFTGSESLQFEALSYSRKTMRFRQSMKEESLAHSSLDQDTITAAKKLREIYIDVGLRNKRTTVWSAGADTVTSSYAGSLGRFFDECQSQGHDG